MNPTREFGPIVIVFAVLALGPLVLGTYMDLGIQVLIWAYLATAWNLLGGYAGQHSLGNGLFMGVGAYGAAYLGVTYAVSPWLAIPITAVIAGAMGAFVGFAVFRAGLKGAYFALVTIALTEAAVYIVSNWDAMGGAAGIEVPYVGDAPGKMQFTGKTWYYLIILAMLFLIMLFTQWQSRRRLGYRLVAVRENEEAAEALGVDTLRAKINATMLSAALTAVGGVFYVQYFTYVGPRSVFGEVVSVQILLFAIIGGLGTVWGPLVGTFILFPANYLLRGSALADTFSGADLLLYGVALVIAMLFMPRGFLGLYQSARDRFAARRANEGPVLSSPGSEGGDA